MGDSNVRRNLTRTNFRASPLLKSAQFLPCGNLQLLSECLDKVDASSSGCILSCLTNFIADTSSTGSVSQRVEQVLEEVRGLLDDLSSARPDLLLFVAPPMYRTSPVWYREGLPEVLTTFSGVMSSEKPANLHLLPSFPTPSFDPDGIHLTSYSGLEFVLHLFDSSIYIMDHVNDPVSEVATKNCESNRALEDRVVALEQDHRRLNGVVEHRIAVEAERFDMRDNEQSEDYFVIAGSGLRPIVDLTSKEWQNQAVKDVNSFLSLLMGSEQNIVVVHNATARHRGAEVTYNVQMQDVATSRLIRKKFGSFFLSGRDERPAELKAVTIRNKITPGTKVRIAILQAMAKRYRDRNQGSKAQVIGYEPRPLIKITPAQGASDRRVSCCVITFVILLSF